MMNFLIADALAEAAPAAPPPGAGLGQLLFMMAIFFALMYFLIIKPQNKRAKEHNALLEGLRKGDEVVTNGGLAGTIAQVGDSFIHLEIAAGVETMVQKQAIALVLPKGSLKNA